LNGDTVRIPDLVMPPARQWDDAPRWLPAVRATPLTNCQSPEALESDGSHPVPVYFHLAPDLFYGERQNLRLHLSYRYNASQVAPGSMLRVVLNSALVNETALSPGIASRDQERLVLVPVEAMRPFGNTIFFNFDFIPASRQDTPQNPGLKGEILCSTSLDLQSLALWTPMPNLQLFANAGFPFTRMADLAETIVILPAAPSSDEISLYLHLMSHFGAQTGYPALRVTVAGPNDVIRKARDYLVLGTVANQPAFRSLQAVLPVTLDARGLHVRPAHRYLSFLSAIEDSLSPWWARLMGNPSSHSLRADSSAAPDALIEEIGSTASRDRSLVLIMLQQDRFAKTFAGAFLDRSQADDISASVSLLRNGQFASYLTDSPAYQVGNISGFALMRIYLTRYFLLLFLAVAALSLLSARWTQAWLKLQARERLKLADTVNVAE
jgi:cellulose synthase (UDP-forming)